MVKYLTIIWRSYNYQLLLVFASLVGLIVDGYLSSGWSNWRLAPAIPLVLCLIYFLWDSISLARSIIPAPQVAYSVCIGKRYEFATDARGEQERSLRKQGIRWVGVQRNFRIHPLDWGFHRDQHLLDDPEIWIATTQELLIHFSNLPRRVEGGPFYHFYLIAPPCICFALGALAGRYVPHAVYHHRIRTTHDYLQVATTASNQWTGFFGEFPRISSGSRKHMALRRFKWN
jgi:hypothetical protein